jgi:hypothetical protein
MAKPPFADSLTLHVRARARPRVSQPGHIEFGTRKWSKWGLLDGNRNRDPVVVSTVVVGAEC